jgi:histidinol-phosphate aminotransferase
MSELLALARPEIRDLKPYMHAVWDPALVRLHANESPWADETDCADWRINRYPEPQPRALNAALAAYYGVSSDRLLLCRGSDEGIDLLMRAFCREGQDRVMICPPTFAMYAFAAAVQGAGIVEVSLRPGFALDAEAVCRSWSPDVKLVFLCSPNNPTGNRLETGAVEFVLRELAGRALVVVDEAYIEFARAPSCLVLQALHPHLIVLRTLSKAHGLAGARCGAVLGAPEVIGLLARIISPYALSAPAIAAAVAALAPDRLARTRGRIERLIAERERLRSALGRLPTIRQIWPSDTNFLLVQFMDAGRAYDAAVRAGLLIRDFSQRPGLNGCLRVTVGMPGENDRLIACLESAA